MLFRLEIEERKLLPFLQLWQDSLSFVDHLVRAFGIQRMNP